MQDDSLVRGQGPGSGGPDSHVQLAFPGFQAGGDGGHFETHEDCGAHFVAVFDFGFCQRGVAVAAPVDGLAATVDGAIQVHLLEDLDIAGLEVGDEGQIGMLPVRIHAQTLEAVTLDVDEALGPFAAQAANGGLGQLAHLFGAQLLFHFMLDGLAMAVPTGDVGGKVAALGVALVDEVLQDLIESMSDVDGPVCIRGSIMQNEGLVVLVLFQDLAVDIQIIPPFQALRLVFGQISAHGEIGCRQIHALLVLVAH